VKIAAELSGDVGTVELDPGQIQQLLVNLIYNAGDALGAVDPPHQIIVATSALELDGKKYVQVEVRDNGPGVPDDRIDGLFRERFTTKRKGHGIGLITCRKIVDAHNGTMGYRTDGGAVFFFRLPVEQPVKAIEGAEVADTPSSKVTGSPTP